MNVNIEHNETEYIRKNIITKYCASRRTLEVRCKYCKNFVHVDQTIDYSHFNFGDRKHLKEIVCGDCYRFSNHWKDRLETHLNNKYVDN
jgi:hypothetical protein